MALVLFLVQVFVISFSGALQPGPVTASAVAMGVRNRWAGALLAVGHAIIEFPLMIFVTIGLGSVLQKAAVKITILIAGGFILLYMAYGMFNSAGKQTNVRKQAREDRPVLAGVVLTASNPYFLLWWATIGLGLAVEATGFGIYAFVLFAVVHWLVDLFWVSLLSMASFHGTAVLGPKLQEIVLRVCAAAMLLFGLRFLYNGAVALF
ncbi:MAG: LysE family transporter [Sedimentisphaerales bacterium]|nr:LysE family transporter [Sedimentisphaerales bacterium]